MMGEFTLANLLLFSTFSAYINYFGETHATPAAALTLVSFGITWLAVLGIVILGRRFGGRQPPDRRGEVDGAPGDPRLGNFAVHHQLGDGEEQTLLRAYFGAVTAGAAVRLKVMKTISDL
jgi:hypothetical protein